MDDATLNELMGLFDMAVAARDAFNDAIAEQAKNLQISKSALRKVVAANAKGDTGKLKLEIEDVCTLLSDRS